MLPPTAYKNLTPDLPICRILNGMWQVSGAHGRIDPDAAVQAMARHHDAGFTTWDLADHYGPAEDFIGRFRREHRPQGMVAFTKWVPQPGSMTREVVENAVQRSLKRMDVESLDLLQFHWWEYHDPGYLTALQHLADMKEVRHLALTNFDTERLRRILDAGIPIVSNQVQYSLVDRRPEVSMAALGAPLLAYGTVLGGLLSEAYLGEPEPQRGQLATASLQKYKRMVDSWGGWDLFQELLHTVKAIADKHRVTISSVAVRFVLDRPSVAGAILGVRLGVTDHIRENTEVFGFSFDSDDLQRLETASAKGRDLYQITGDCGDEYR